MEEKIDENESSGLTEEDMRILGEISKEIFGDVVDDEVKVNDEYNPKVTYLKLQDKTVMCFDGIGTYCQVFDNELLPFILRDRIKTLPYYNKLSSEEKHEIETANYNAIERFIDLRVTPIQRKGAKTIYNNLWIPQKLTTSGGRDMLLLGCGLSASDDYWMTTDINEKWADVNLRANPLDQRIAEMALLGDAHPCVEEKDRHHLITPEFTTQGKVAKVWHQENGKLVLYKSAWYVEDSLPQKKEVLVSNILDCFNVPHVHYDLVTKTDPIYDWELTLSRCEAINNSDYSIVDALDIAMWRNNEIGELEFAKMVDSDLFYKTIVVDYLVSNPDRHLGNWGFFMNNKTGEIAGMHPLFDHNNAFDEDCMKDPTKFECQMMPDINLKDAAKVAINRCDLRCIKPVTRDIFFDDAMYLSFMSRAEELGLYKRQEVSLFKRIINSRPNIYVPVVVKKNNENDYWQKLNKVICNQNLVAYKQEKEMQESRETVIRRKENGRMLLNRFINTAAKKSDVIGLDKSVVAACKKVIGNHRATAVIRRDMINEYLNSIGEKGTNIMEYVKSNVDNFSKARTLPHKANKGLQQMARA